VAVDLRVLFWASFARGLWFASAGFISSLAGATPLPNSMSIAAKLGRFPIISNRAADAVGASHRDSKLPTARALDALWNEVRSRPLYAPPNFFRYLRLRARMRLALVDPSEVRIAAVSGQVNDCEACTENCCVGPHNSVLLRLVDIARLIDLGRTELIASNKPSFDEATVASRPALRRQLNSQAWEVFPTLNQNSFGACMALDLDGRCTLYPHWPVSCARFPYALRTECDEVFYSQRCKSFWIRPDEASEMRAHAMAANAVAAYNERLKDLVLLEYARDRLDSLGLLDYLTL
jgi:Fe-S-cluster containining protein